MGAPVLIQERPGGKYTNDVIVRDHKQYVDEPLEYNSADIGPSPFEYVCAGLGGCTTITIRMYAGRKNWALDHVSCLVTHEKKGDEHVFTRQVTLKGNLDAAQRERLIEIANKCPVHKMLTAEGTVNTVEVTG